MEKVDEMVTMTKEQYDQLIDRLDKLEKSGSTPATTPVTVAPNAGTYNTPSGTMMPMPFQPARKESGWSTAGKVFLGTLIGIAGTCIISALAGVSGGDNNTFGGSMPG